MFSTQTSTYRYHFVSCFSCHCYPLMSTGQTELVGSLWEAASEGLRELRTPLAKDTILPRLGKPRWKDPIMFLNINQPRSLLWWRQVMSQKELGLEFDRFKFESLLLNLLALLFWINHLLLPSQGFFTYKMTLMINLIRL